MRVSAETARDRTSRGQQRGVARNAGWAYVEANEPIGYPPVNITMHIGGGGNANETAFAVRRAIEQYFDRAFTSRGLYPR